MGNYSTDIPYLMFFFNFKSLEEFKGSNSSLFLYFFTGERFKYY